MSLGVLLSVAGKAGCIFDLNARDTPVGRLAGGGVLGYDLLV